MRRARLVLVAVALTAGSACSGPSAPTSVAGPDPTTTAGPPPPASAPTAPPTTRSAPGTVRPDWLGTRVLAIGPDGVGQAQPTPPELVDRAFPTIDVLAPPTTEVFAADVSAVPADVLARSTWTPACPVAADDLRYVTLPFWGFDGARHTGELLVHAGAVSAVLLGMSALYDLRFPIEEMRITTAAELDAAPTGDGNNTAAFVCRPSVGTSSWSQHAYGRALDINPFQNPYVKGDTVIPELASVFTDRTDVRPGMLTDATVARFEEVGWGWGGRWSTSLDFMHLSATGR